MTETSERMNEILDGTTDCPDQQSFREKYAEEIGADSLRDHSGDLEARLAELDERLSEIEAELFNE
jgi:hypothetical protein